MFVPNSIVTNRLASENVGFWLDYDSSSFTIGLIAKLPTMAIKSILLGAPIIIHFGVSSGDVNYISLGMSINDNEETPLIFIRPIKDELESPGLIHLINNNFARITLTFFNDLNHSVAYGVVKLETEFINSIKITLIDGFSTPSSLSLLNILADSFFSEVVPNYLCDEILPTKIISQYLVIDELKSYPLSIYNNSLPKMHYDLSVGANGSEGYVQEKMLASALVAVFQDTVTPSPKIMDGQKKRELIDILAVDGINILMIESKSSGIVERGRLVSMARHKSTTNRLLREALGQVTGVAKRCSVGVELVDNDKEVVINNKNNKHIVIIIPELSLVEGGESNQSANDIYDATGCKIHVLDMHAFINFIKLSRNHPPLFWANLEDRFWCSYNNKTFNIQDIDSSLPM